MSPSMGSQGCHNYGALWGCHHLWTLGCWHHYGALGCVIMGLSGGCHHHGALGGGGGAITIMELSGDVNTDTGLLDMISKLFIMN